MGAYIAALEAAVRPGCAVADIGTGTGILAMIAARLGARIVYAIEVSANVELAERIVRANALEDRIRLLHGHSTEIHLPERVEVIVSDIHGATPLHDRHLSSIIDARRRFLAPGGTLIPGVETLWAAPARCDDIRDRLLRPWEREIRGLTLAPAIPFAANQVYSVDARAADLASDPQQWAVLDYRTLEADRVRGDLAWTMSATDADGLLVWFDADLGAGARFSNRPGEPPLYYGQLFLPWPSRMRFHAGDTLRVALRSDPAGSVHVWTWDTVASADGIPRARLRQSTLLSLPLTAGALPDRVVD
jgi:SAM-dependent methyltransferase